MDQQTGKYILIVGIFIVIAGLLVYFFHDYFKWIGRLPGDIRIEKGNFRFYFPWVTMILLSIVITVIISILKRFF
jgi:H+/Cl- antiporter ClcA